MKAKLAWQSCIYNLWLERNARIYRGTVRNSTAIVEPEDQDVKNRLLSLYCTCKEGILVESQWKYVEFVSMKNY